MTSLSLFTFLHWRRKWQPTPVFLPGESQGRGAWWAAIYGVAQSWIRLRRLGSRQQHALLPHFSEEETEPQRGTLTWIGQNRELSRAGDLNSEPLVFQCCYMQGLNELSCAKVSATHAFGLFDVSSSRPFEWKLWADLASGQKS